MSLPARLVLGIVALSVVSLTPVVPDTPLPAAQQNKYCTDMNMVDACNRCPINPGGTSSSSGTCCNTPAVCLLLYFSGSKDFVPGMSSSRMRDPSNDRVTAGSQRPLVPPPRVELS